MKHLAAVHVGSLTLSADVHVDEARGRGAHGIADVER